jgi:Flp pilus assembly protein protease CpaA
MLLEVFGAWVVLSMAAVTDWRRHVIPNGLWLGALAGAACGMIAGWIPVTHLFWSAGIWAVYEFRAWRHPQFHPGSVSWGDVKLIVALTAMLGVLGVWIAIGGEIAVWIVGSAQWLRHPRQSTWKGQQVPWAPGAWVAMTSLGILFWIIRS